MRIDCTAACSVGQGAAPSLLTLPWGWWSAPCCCPVLRGRGAQPAGVPGVFLLSGALLGQCVCVSCGGVEALGGAGCTQRRLHVKHCPELWLKVHRGHCGSTSSVRGEGYTEPGNLKSFQLHPARHSSPRIAAAAWGRGWHKLSLAKDSPFLVWFVTLDSCSWQIN